MSTYDMVNNDNWPEIPFVLICHTALHRTWIVATVIVEVK